MKRRVFLAGFGSLVFSMTGNFVNAGQSIYLTIDDGPLDSMGLILDNLKKFNSRATFFCVGRLLKSPKRRDLVLRALGEGHCIGNHSYTHPEFHKLNSNRTEYEIEKTHELVGNILNSNGTPFERNGLHFRFPYGIRTKRALTKLNELGYIDYLWDVDSEDWKFKIGLSEKEIFRKSVIGNAGDIILIHDRVFSADRLLKHMLNNYTQRGFNFEALNNYEI